MSLYTTMRKEKARNHLEGSRPTRSSTKCGLRHVDTAVMKGGRKDLIEFRRSLRADPFEACPLWQTSNTGDFRGMQHTPKGGNYRRVKPMAQIMNPLMPSDY